MVSANSTCVAPSSSEESYSPWHQATKSLFGRGISFVVCWLEKWYQSGWLWDISSPPVHSGHGPDSSWNSFIRSTWSSERDALWFASWCVVDGLYILRNTDTYSTLHGVEHVWPDVSSESRRLSTHRCALRVGVMWTVDSSPDLRNIIHSMLQVDPK